METQELHQLINNQIKVEDLVKEDLDNILLNNNIEYLYKNKEVNDFKNLDYKIKEYISIGQNFTIETDTNISSIQPKIKNFTNRDYFDYAGGSGGFMDKYCSPYARGRVFNTIEKDKRQYDDP